LRHGYHAHLIADQSRNPHRSSIRTPQKVSASYNYTQFVSLVMGLSDFISDPGDFGGVKTMTALTCEGFT
jgi:hypothetical protein